MGTEAVRRRDLGRLGEEMATRWYEDRGYEILARNWACRAGELDIVARKGWQYVFCEVKTRSSVAFGLPAEAVGRQKQARLRRLAAMWLAAGRTERPWGHMRLRFDVASVMGGAVQVIEEAF